MTDSVMRTHELLEVVKRESAGFIGSLCSHPSVPSGPFVIMGVGTDNVRWFVRILSLDTFTINNISVGWNSTQGASEVLKKYNNFFSATWVGDLE